MCSLGGFAHEVLELGKDLFDGVQIGRVWREEQQARANAADRHADGGPFVAAQIIHNDDVACRQGWDEALLDIIEEAVAVDRLIKDARSIDPVAAQCRQEGHRFPMAVGHLGIKPFALGAPTAQRGHVRLHPRLIDEDEPSGINPALIFLPLFAPSGNLGTELFGG